MVISGETTDERPDEVNWIILWSESPPTPSTQHARRHVVHARSLPLVSIIVWKSHHFFLCQTLSLDDFMILFLAPYKFNLHFTTSFHLKVIISPLSWNETILQPPRRANLESIGLGLFQQERKICYNKSVTPVPLPSWNSSSSCSLPPTNNFAAGPILQLLGAEKIWTNLIGFTFKSFFVCHNYCILLCYMLHLRLSVFPAQYYFYSPLET